jgi:glutamine amidotransferase
MPDEIVIVDYGMGNLRSVQKALEHVGAAARVTGDPGELVAPGMILPGVGAFRDAMDRLHEAGLVEPILRHIADGKPFLGVCLGLHLLFSEGEEFGLHRGLDVIPGRVVRFSGGKKIPHMGWNTLTVARNEGVLEGIPSGTSCYFVHSYYARPAEEGWVGATTEYGEVFPSVISRGNLTATQFHPEKSQAVGLRILGNFVNMVRRSMS